MAASMENVRVKLSFQNIAEFSNQIYKSVWHLVNTETFQTIKDVENDVISKFNLCKEKPIQFTLDGCLLLPPDRSIILRENDFLSISYQDTQTSLINISQHLNGMSSLLEDEEDLHSPSQFSMVKKKKKRKKSRESKECEYRIDVLLKNDVSGDEKLTEPRKRKLDGDIVDTPKIKTKKRKKSKHSETKEREKCEEKVSSSVETESKNSKTKLPEIVIDESHTPLSKNKNEVGGEDKSPTDDVKKRRRRRKRSKKNKDDAPPSGENKSPFQTPVVPVYPKKDTTTMLSLRPPNKKIKGKRKHVVFDSDNEKDTDQPETPKNDTNPSPLEHQSTSASVNSPVSRICKNDMEKSSYPSESTSSDIVLQTNDVQKRLEAVANQFHYSYKDETNSSNELSTPSHHKNTASEQLKGNSRFSDTKVFKRKNMKRAPFVPLSKEEQLNSMYSNTSVVFQNGVEDTNIPCEETTSQEPDLQLKVPRDYSILPNLHGPPRVGDTIAYKILEMGENYCPEISNYKEAHVLAYDPTTQSLQLELIGAELEVKRLGRFDLMVEYEDEILTNTSQDKLITVTWTSVVEPKLIPI